MHFFPVELLNGIFFHCFISFVFFLEMFKLLSWLPHNIQSKKTILKWEFPALRDISSFESLEMSKLDTAYWVASFILF